MKKRIFYAVAFVLPLAYGTSCGSDTTANVEVNTDGTSSVVETTNPEGIINSNSQEHFEGDGHDHSAGATGENTSIEYITEKHDFGTVFYPSDNPYTFKFKNTGSVPLIISDATASCGCTIPNKPEKPIMPGEIGELDVIFRPKEGQIGQTVTKKITVTANTVPKETYLEISATVVEAM